MLNPIRFEPGATVPLHSHPHEQPGIVVEGMQALVVDRTVYELRPFEAYVLPGGVEHSARRPVPPYTATVTRRKVAGIEVASSRGLAF